MGERETRGLILFPEEITLVSPCTVGDKRRHRPTVTSTTATQRQKLSFSFSSLNEDTGGKIVHFFLFFF